MGLAVVLLVEVVGVETSLVLGELWLVGGGRAGEGGAIPSCVSVGEFATELKDLLLELVQVTARNADVSLGE